MGSFDWAEPYATPGEIERAKRIDEDRHEAGEAETVAREIAEQMAVWRGLTAVRAHHEYRARRAAGQSRLEAWETTGKSLAHAPSRRVRRSARRRGAGRPRAAATRSSCRSGDSGPDGEPGSPPPPRIAWRHLEQQHAARTRAHLRGVRS
jgi:hypothetical protein